MSDGPLDQLISLDDPDRDAGLASRISTQMVRTMKEYYGKGPVAAKSYLVDDLLFVVLREGMTRAERTMLDAGRESTVRHFRQEFEIEMTERLTTLVEELTGRRVVTYQSQVLFDPDMSIEMFVFADGGPSGPTDTTGTVSAEGR